MLCERRYPLGLILTLVLAAVLLSGRLRAEMPVSSADSRAVLYLATVAGRYTTDKRFIDTPVFCQADRITYGFPRSLEAGLSQWQVSVTLPSADVPVRIRCQDMHP